MDPFSSSKIRGAWKLAEASGVIGMRKHPQKDVDMLDSGCGWMSLQVYRISFN